MSQRRQREESCESETETLLKPTPKRFVSLPVLYPDLWAMYKQAEASVWTVSDIDLGNDMKDWESLNDGERHFIKHVLAFFASSDGVVNENLAQRFYNDVQVHEARAFYALQMFVETVHSETYALLIDTYVKNEQEKQHLFNAIETVPCVQKKAQWALQWIGSEATFQERLIAFACVEGIFFSGSFCAIFWLKKRGILPGLCFSNEYISRDESLHQDFACLLYKDHIVNKLNPHRVCRIVGQAVAIEKEFVRDALPVRLIGMNADQMCQYIEFCANRLLEALGLQPMYHEWQNRVKINESGPSNSKYQHTTGGSTSVVYTGSDLQPYNIKPIPVPSLVVDGYRYYPEGVKLDCEYEPVKMGKVKNPFDFMEMISLQGKTNFFEKKVGDYQKAGVMASKDGEASRVFSLEDEF